MNALHVEPAGTGTAPSILALRTSTSQALTSRFGRGHWSSLASDRGVAHSMRTGRVFIARRGECVVATFRLATRKPWAIDKSYFTPRPRAVYLTDMAVEPALQLNGLGRLCLEAAVRIARVWPADVIRLDAYDAPAGAGGFYEKCGFREVGRVAYRGVPLIYYELLLS